MTTLRKIGKYEKVLTLPICSIRKDTECDLLSQETGCCLQGSYCEYQEKLRPRLTKKYLKKLVRTVKNA